jgi:hypothetical protein
MTAVVALGEAKTLAIISPHSPYERVPNVQK